MKPNRVVLFHENACSVAGVVHQKIEDLIAQKYPKLDFVPVNASEEQTLAAQHQVFVIPTLLVFFENKEYYRFVRIFSIQEVDAKIERIYKMLFA